MSEPVISTSGTTSNTGTPGRWSAVGGSFAIHEWRGSGPAALHVHHADDEAWHVLDGTLRFRFIDRVVDVGPGGTVFVPAGVAHAYEALAARYLIILTPRLDALIAELQQSADRAQHAAVYRKYESELLEP
jgi:mannose-6-phosphate isomerase-like protein (cupin superfamily)